MEWLRKLLGLKTRQETPSIVAKLQKEDGNIYILRLGGVFNKPTMDNIQTIAVQEIARGTRDIRLLIVLTDFRGWKKGDDWGDMDFFASHEANISRIAVIGDARWESDTLIFLCADRRTGMVKYFTPDLESSARAWLKS